jgi:hypothetical protein
MATRAQFWRRRAWLKRNRHPDAPSVRDETHSMAVRALTTPRAWASTTLATKATHPPGAQAVWRGCSESPASEQAVVPRVVVVLFRGIVPRTSVSVWLASLYYASAYPRIACLGREPTIPARPR